MRFSRENTDRSPAADSVSARGWSKSLVQAVLSGISSLLPGPKVADTPRVPFIRSGYDVVRIIAAAVLLVAAGLKTHQLSTEPIIGTGILDSRWLLMASVEFELFFGLWLLSNIMPRATWMAAIGLFGLFTCVSLYKALSGAASCGCFGRMEVNPWYTTALDLAIMASLLRWRSRGLFPSHILTFARFTAIAVLWLAIGLPAGYAMGTYADATLSDAGEIIDNGKVVVLQPEKWIGKEYPLLNHISIGAVIKEGKWLVLLYDGNCPKCQRMIQHVPANIRKCKYGAKQMALIKISSTIKSTDTHTMPLGIPLVHGRLHNADMWFIQSPIEVLLDNGIVRRSSDSFDK